MPLTPFESLAEEARAQGISIDEDTLQPTDPLDGLCLQETPAEPPLILLNRHRPASARTVALAEELGHCRCSAGDLSDLSDPAAQKSENQGRAWAYQRLAPPEAIRAYLRQGYFSFPEIAEELSITPAFLLEAMAYYQRKGLTFQTAADADPDTGVVILGRNLRHISPARLRAFARLMKAAAAR